MTSSDRPKVLLVNPWAYDFAAFDLWARPLGLLYLAAGLAAAGLDLHLVDCLDRLHPESEAPRPRSVWPAGTGQWTRTLVRTPPALAGIPRHYARYGLPEAVFRRDIATGPRPDLVLVTSILTYWYPGVRRAIELIRENWPEVPVILGGHYASLCPDHAQRTAGADLLCSGPGEPTLAPIIRQITGLDLASTLASSWTTRWPALELYPRLDFAPVLTSRGCPFRCPYCASRHLYPGFDQRRPEDVLAEIEDRHHRLGLADYTFFDDALLVNAEGHLKPILEGVISKGLKLNFHVPNGLHVGLIDPELARLMFRAGFRSLRLGLETLDPERQSALGGKVEPGQFETALASLRMAGFSSEQIGIYILWGMPGQDPTEALATAAAVRAVGARPHLAEYSPLPGSALWDAALAASSYDLAGEPLYQNNSFFPCRWPGFTWREAWAMKREALSGRPAQQAENIER